MNTETLLLISGALAAYCIGSVPTAVWVGRWFYGVDVRKQGSGNAGATNTVRVLGLKAGIPVLLFDAFKGWLAVWIGNFFAFSFTAIPNVFINYKIFLGIMAVTGHVFPLWAGFKGGKGVATLVGIIIALFPEAFFVALGIFALVFALWRYVSLASIVAAITFPFFVIVVLGEENWSLVIFSLLIAIFVPITHKKNIKRLLKGEENRFNFRKKKTEE